MRYPKIVIGLVAAGLLTSACGSDDSSSSSSDDKKTSSSAGADTAGADGGDDAEKADEGKPLAVAVTGPPEDVIADRSGDEAEKLKIEPKPERGAPFEEQVKHKLREDVLGKAQVVGKTSAECPDGVTLEASAVSTCVVEYEGAKIPYEIKISDKYKPGGFITMYNTKPEKGLLVAKQVHHRLWESHGKNAPAGEDPQLSCDEIPVAEAVDLNTDTDYTCQVWNKYGGEKNDGGFDTYTVQMKTGIMGSWSVSFERAPK